MTLTLNSEYVGFRIWYADGSVKSNLDGAWDELPGQEVQFVTVYESRTYPIWIEDKWVTENYCIQLHSEDYYWLDSEGQPHAGGTAEVPDDLPQGAIKTGSEMFDRSFWDLAANAQTVRVAP